MQRPSAPHDDGKKKSSWPSVIFAILGIATPIVLFLAIWQFLAPEDRRQVVSYDQFIAEVRSGHVYEIRIHDRDIDYRNAYPASTVVKHTTGPVPNQAFLDTLKPDDPNMPAPKIVFEK